MCRYGVALSSLGVAFGSFKYSGSSHSAIQELLNGKQI